MMGVSIHWTGLLNSFSDKFLCLFLERSLFSFKLTSSYLTSMDDCKCNNYIVEACSVFSNTFINVKLH